MLLIVNQIDTSEIKEVFKLITFNEDTIFKMEDYKNLARPSAKTLIKTIQGDVLYIKETREQIHAACGADVYNVAKLQYEGV